MKSQYNEFIGMYQNVFPDGFCSHMISEFERLLSSGSCVNRQDGEGAPKTKKEDYHFLLGNVDQNPGNIYEPKWKNVGEEVK